MSSKQVKAGFKSFLKEDLSYSKLTLKTGRFLPMIILIKSLQSLQRCKKAPLKRNFQSKK